MYEPASERTGYCDQANQHNGARTTFASLAAIGSVLAASSCCLPILPFMMAAGLAGTSTFLSAARPYLLVAAVLFIAYGFYQSKPGCVIAVLVLEGREGRKQRVH